MLNSINNYSSIGTRKGVGGLASGLDTDELVKGMTASTRNKLTKQLQSRELLAWKATAYRGISTKLIDISQKYMSYTSNTNLLSELFFSNNTVKSMGSNAGAVSVTGNSDILKNLKVNSVKELASSAHFVTTGDASKGSMGTGEIDLSAAGKKIHNLAGETLNISYGGVSYNVTMTKDTALLPADGATRDQMITAFNEALKSVKTNIEDGAPGADGVQKYKTLDQVIKMTAGSITETEGSVVTTHLTMDIKAVDPEDGTVIELVGGSGDSMKALGINDENNKTLGPKSAIHAIWDETKMTSIIKFNEAMAGKTMSFTYNGVQKSITFPKDKESTVFDSIGGLQKYMQGELDTKFGKDKIKVDLGAGQNVADSKGSLAFRTSDENSTLAFSGADSGIAGFKGAMNFTANLSNRLNITRKLGEANLANTLSAGADGKYKISVNGKEFTFDEKTAIRDVMDTINRSDAGVNIKYLNTTDTFSIMSTETGEHTKVEIKDVAGGGNLAESMFGKAVSNPSDVNAANRTYMVEAGTDSEMEVDFGQGAVTIKRSNNSFDLDGINFTLNTKFDSTAPSGGDKVTFNSVKNTDKIIEGIKAFVKDYNDLIADANKQIGTKPDRNYAPLTAEQAEGMTESQIKEWETKAQGGMLFGDPTVSSLATDMRFMFSFDVPGLGSLKDMGISVSSAYEDNGKVTIDDAKLKKALEENSDDVMKAFIAPNPSDSKANPYGGGLMTRMEAIVTKYASTTGEKGSLIRLAGLEGSLTTMESFIYKQTQMINNDVDRLGKSLKSEEDRYFRQFTTLEKYIAQMNSQSSWLTSQFG